MSYPSKIDIASAVKNPQFIRDAFLQNAHPLTGRNGRPVIYTGGFSMVFPLSKGNEKWAFRVWHVPLKDVKNRYISISEHLNKHKLKYFADFSFVGEGLLVNGQLLDTSRMKWVDGVLLKDFIAFNLQNKTSLETLAEDFLQMNVDLRRCSISHGDLQHDNILISDTGEIKLVDYDSVCVPQVQEQGELVSGLKGYQHPSRLKGGKASLKADYFSELIIYLSILGIAEDPSLWDKYQVEDSNTMLFEAEDFNDFESSGIYKDLWNLSPKINTLVRILLDYLKEDNYLSLEPFSSYFDAPAITRFEADKEFVLDGIDVTLSWEVVNARKVILNQGIGEVTSFSEIKVKPDKTSLYTLRVVGFFEDKEESIEVRVFPTPIVESLFVPAPVIKENINLQIRMPEFPTVNLSFNDIPEEIKKVNGLTLLSNQKISPFPKFSLNSVEPTSQYKINLSGLLEKIKAINSRIMENLNKSH